MGCGEVLEPRGNKVEGFRQHTQPPLALCDDLVETALVPLLEIAEHHFEARQRGSALDAVIWPAIPSKRS
jgi:hypothetical protein